MGSTNARCCYTPPVRITLIAAAAENNVIGAKGKIPWRLPNDLRRFRRLTEGHPVIMGRKTREAMGRNLPGRRNIVVTRQQDVRINGCDVVHSLDEALDLARAGGAEDVFIIGGGELYREALPLADRIELTRVHMSVEGDAVFPEFHPEEWNRTFQERHEADAEHAVPYTFLTYERKL